jgi:hypothetical protein
VLVRYGLEWARKYWSLKGMCEVDVCCDPFFASTLTCVKIIETIVESV